MNIRFMKTVFPYAIGFLCMVNVVQGYPQNSKAVIGYFWQITDFHYDVNYTLHGDPSKMCHYSPSAVHYNLGKYGDYNCDSPWSLVQASINVMNDLHANPDFILWTGDSVPHVNYSSYSENKVFSVIHNITDALITRFPNTSILPMFGNHDPYPTNQMPSDDPHYYNSILDISEWRRLLPPNANETFVKGGYYSYEVSPQLKVICLNTALYYHTNNLTNVSNDNDPSLQFIWLASELEKSKLVNQKVYIAAHVPPGVFELDVLFKWFHDDLNSKYLDVIDGYNDVIVAHFYGHEHTDSFRVYNSKGHDSAMFLSPAVTPWKSTVPGANSNNPSVRLYKYDRSSGNLLDYYQYYLNLTAANQGTGNWGLEYQFTKAYDVSSLHPKVVRRAAENIVNGKDKRYLKRYLTYNTVSAVTNVSCDDICLRHHKCAILNLRYPELDKCLSTRHPTHHHHKHTSTSKPHHHHHKTPEKVPRYMTWIIISLAVVLFLLAILVMVVCFRPRRYALIGRNHAHAVDYGSIKF